MFVLSKVVWLVSQPLSLALSFSVLAMIAILLRRRFVGLVLLALPVAILFVAQFTTVGPLMIQALEDRFPRPAGDPADLKCMIVLGGGFANDVDTARGAYNLNDAGDRFVEVVRLARKYPQARIVVSGGDGNITGGMLGDAPISARMFAALDIPRERVFQDPDSRTTYENAVNTKQLLAANGLSDCLLITSGFHMPRSVGIFRKLDIPVTPWVVDYRSTGREYLRLDITQPDANVSMLGVALREWFGMVGYYAVGRTSELYPGPK